MLRVLSWNVMHGRSVPGSGRELRDEFSSLIAGWEWDVALLQEVPPWWPAPLAAASGADQRSALTSRNALLAVRRAVAVRRPDLIRSNGGGCNAILVRRAAIEQHRVSRLSWWPERRWLHAVRLAGGTWVGNVHTGSYAAQGQRAASVLREWSAGGPVILGGDFNVPELSLDGFTLAGAHGVDQVFAGGGLVGGGPADVLERGSLSDHAPVLVSVMEKAEWSG